MITRLLFVSVLLASAPAFAAGHALVVTNNRSLDLERPDLQYADDDGAKWVELFDDLIGDDVTLLTELDAATRALHPDLASRPPTRANLDAAVQALRARLDADHDGPRVVYLVFAGHGDVADGQGFLELADERFTATDLEALVSALPAERIHLVMDACNAWFMLHPRKPGAQRFTREVVAKGLLDRHPNVGALLSTSAEAVAWEWSEIQSGIFSHVARSGLRGAADADRDGTISYGELEAWLAIAHAPIDNEAYRPRIFAQAPKDAATFVDLRGPGRNVTLELPSARRLTVRDERGLRILDMNLEAGAPVSLRLPATALAIDELHAGTPRPTMTLMLLPVGEARIGSGGTARDTATRGDGTLFKKLFSEPFGSQSIAEWRTTPRAEVDAPYGVTARDAERLGNVLHTSARIEHSNRTAAGLIATGVGVAGGLAGFGLLSAASNDDEEVLGWSVGIMGSVFTISGLIITLVPGELEDIALDYEAQRPTTEAERAALVARFELRLAEEADSYRRLRLVTGWIGVGIGGLCLGSGILGIHEEGFNTRTGVTLGLGIATLGFGLFSAIEYRNAVEETWDLYQNLREIPWAPGEGPKVAPLLGPIDGGFMLGAQGTF